METSKQKVDKMFDSMKGDFGYVNAFQAPKLEKIVISNGTGSKSKTDRTRNDFISKKLGLIAGQKPSVRQAKKSIAGFKIRTGDAVGQAVTLRGERMYSFLDKLINVALPRTKDFRGVKRSSVDTIGNMTIGIKENTIFPETGDEDIKDIFGLSITLVSTAKDKKEAERFFEEIGMPFKK